MLDPGEQPAVAELGRSGGKPRHGGVAITNTVANAGSITNTVANARSVADANSDANSHANANANPG